MASYDTSLIDELIILSNCFLASNISANADNLFADFWQQDLSPQCETLLLILDNTYVTETNK